MFLALGLGDVPGIINNALRSLTAWLCEIIYTAIAGAYQLFMDLALLTFDESLTKIYNKISLIIGIFMVFRVIFWLIELLVSPDKISDKEKNPGNIITKILISVVLLATTPRIFKIAFEFQYQIISKNIIANIIVLDSEEDYTAEDAGKIMAGELFINFYTINVLAGNTVSEVCQRFAPSLTNKQEKGYYYKHLVEYGKLENLSNNICLIETGPLVPDSTTGTYEQTKGYVIDFNGLFATLVGGIVLWMIIMYCISLGARYVQLIFLQVIAPIPIMCYLTPKKDNMFSKWVQQCTTTYLDVFIRMAIISFVMLISMLILNNDNNVILNVANSSASGWIKIFLVLGLLTFAKRAPDLIQELLPKSVTKASGDFGLSWKKRSESMLFGGAVKTVGRAATLGVAGAAITGAVGFLGGRGSGRVSGLLGGMGRGFISNSKKGGVFKNLQSGIKQQGDISKKKMEWAKNGSTWYGRMDQRLSNAFGFEGKAESYENQMAEYDKKLTSLNTRSSAYKEVSDSVGKMEDRATNQLDTKTFKPEQTYQRNLQARRRNYKAISQAMANGDHSAALIEANNEITRVNRRLVELRTAGITSGEEFDKVTKEKDKIDEIIRDINSNNYSAAKAEEDRTDVFTETRNEYITQSLQDENGDSAIKNEAQHIKDVASHEDNREAFAEFTSNSDGVTYDSFDKFSSEAKKANSALVPEIYKTKTAKEAIANSEAKKAADADRNAVGGHKGGSK